MVQKENVILYHAYGSTALHQQVLFSVLTLHYHLKGIYKGIQIVIYTDNKSFYKELVGFVPVSFELLTNDLISTYKGVHNFVHRVKIEIIKDCFERYQKNILYLDSDTYFTCDPTALIAKIDASTSIMNSDDYDLEQADELYENLDWLMIRRAIRDFEYSIDGSRIKIPLTTRMWNAGIIGLSYENKSILDAILNLTDQIYANRPVFTAEQFSFSYFLQHKTALLPSGEVIFHYWPNFAGKKWKELYSYHFHHFFKKTKKNNIDQKAQLAYQLTTRHHEITKSTSMRTIDRAIRRINLAWKILRKGKI